MSKRTQSVWVVVTQTVTECLETIVRVPEGASEQEIANRAAALAVDIDHGWCVTENPWTVEINRGGTLSAPFCPDFDAVEVIRRQAEQSFQTEAGGQCEQAPLQAVRVLIANALDWNGESEFVDVRKEDFDALAEIIIKSQGRA